jgi:hypothetical protein
MHKLLLSAASALLALASPLALADNPPRIPPPTASQFVELSAHDGVRQMARGLAIVRQSNPKRNVILGGVQWNSRSRSPADQSPGPSPGIVSAISRSSSGVSSSGFLPLSPSNSFD